MLWTKHLSDKRVLVILGPGGVGKTTMSLAVAFLAAINGKRVAVLSIDPAKRLASAIGIALGAELKALELPLKLNIRGQIAAAMLDPKAVFDQMVTRYTPNESIRAKILQNPLYQAICSNMSGVLEYMALAKLHELVESDRYDLIILDTPPDNHALDFLVRPNILSAFVEHKVINWLFKPLAFAQRLGMNRIITLGEKLAGGLAEISGIIALEKIAEFTVLMQEVITGFHQSGSRIKTILADPTTQFILITMPKNNPMRSLQNIAIQLIAQGHRLDLVIFNRCMPPILEQHLTANPPEDAAEMFTKQIKTLANRRAEQQRYIQLFQDWLTAHDLTNVSCSYCQEYAQPLINVEALYKFATILDNSL